jgi:uncharacterized protein (DUF885 family)
VAKSEFERFVSNYHDHFTRDANACVNLGVEVRLGELPDPSDEGRALRLGEADDLLRNCDAVSRAGLDFDDKLDLDLAQLNLTAEVHRDRYTWRGQNRLSQMPTAADDIGDGIFMLFINDPRPAAERLANVTDRIAAVPAYLSALRSRLGSPLERWQLMDLEKVAELPSLFMTLENWAVEVDFTDLPRLRLAREKAEMALRGYAADLATLETHRELHLEGDTASRIVKLRGIEKELPDLHRMATNYLAQNAEVLEELRGRLASKYQLPGDASVETVQAELLKQFALKISDGDLDRVLERYEEERQRVLTFIEAHRLFPILENQDMKILRTPGFMAPSIPAGAMVSPAPFREGTRTSLIYLTLSEELLAEHSELNIPGMMIHEGIPGHHLQLATAATHPSVIRRHTSAMDQAEGWTTMLEDYMLDVGYMGELTDEARFVAKRDTNRIGARVAIDLYFMTGDRNYLDVGVECDLSPADPFVAAGNLLRTVTGFVPGRVEAELNWYSQERGYPLSYLTGNRLVWELKRDVASARGDGVGGMELDREFHDVYLHSGNMPVSFLRKVFVERGML